MLPDIKEDLLNIKEVDNANLTYRIDFNNNIIDNKIDELEALKQSIFLCLNTPRYVHPIYSFNYGNELERLLGTDTQIWQIELERYVKEALSADERIEEIKDFKFYKNKSIVKVDFTVISIYGSHLQSFEIGGV